MRRTVGLLVGMSAALALAGAAGATTGRDPAGPAAAESQVRPAQVGAVEQVRKIIGYADTPRSATFRYPGSSYVKVHFARVLLLPGDSLTVSDARGTEVHRYDADPYRAVAALAGAGRWAMSVTGDTAVVTLHHAGADPLGVRSALAGLGVEIDRVARGFTPAERAARVAEAREPGRTGREESVCGTDEKADAVCYRSRDPVAYRSSKAVVRLLINGAELCTAWRVGPNNRLVTNNHCFTDSESAYNTEVWFNYQCAVCGGFAVFRPTKVWGDRVLFTDRALDLTVFTVEHFAEVQKFGFLEFDPVRPAAGQEVFIPQNPGGDPTVIATASDEDRAGNCGVADPAYDGYAPDSDVSYYCDTAGGSSGSPVLSRRTGKVIALHHFGGCPNSGVRADLILRRIKHLL